MNPYEINPFQVLYVTDSPDPRAFVELFSDIPVIHASALFEPGNVVLKGTQGSGKSMLLNLLHPAIRLEYAKASLKFPAPESVPQFVGAGINLTLSGALNIGQRPIHSTENEDELFPLYFADFLNCYIAADLLQSLELMGANPGFFDRCVDSSRLNGFAAAVSRDSCWFGYLDGVDSFEKLASRMLHRLTAYRKFHQYNGELPDDISGTKTGIGEPLSRIVDILRATGVIAETTPVFVRIDQIERLYRSDMLRPQLGQEYRRVINKAISGRDTRVSYRVGARTYAWDDDLTIFRTGDQLEALRDYRQIDLDEVLRRKEARSTWLFPSFAADAFARRMRLAGCSDEDLEAKKPKQSKVDLLGKVFGSTPAAKAVASEICQNTTAERALRLTKEFSIEWKEFLTSLFESDPLDAVLAAAWARQRGQSGPSGVRLKKPPPATSRPWEKATWRDERIRIAMLQLAARCAQRLKWSGKDAIIALSSGNISIFLNLCYEIWDSFLRAERLKPTPSRIDPLKDGIPGGVQAVGIQTASTHWYNKITERPKGSDRQRFIDIIGRRFRDWLADDDAMSYPGQNGFSLTLDELERDPFVKCFLNEAVDYGDLFDAIHTTKEQGRKSRRKWYVAPILSVFFQIPEAHKKEPHYATLSEVREWLSEAGVVSTQQLMFDFVPTK